VGRCPTPRVRHAARVRGYKPTPHPHPSLSRFCPVKGSLRQMLTRSVLASLRSACGFRFALDMPYAQTRGVMRSVQRRLPGGEPTKKKEQRSVVLFNEPKRVFFVGGAKPPAPRCAATPFVDGDSQFCGSETKQKRQSRFCAVGKRGCRAAAALPRATSPLEVAQQLKGC
jgi:hypothetical protein